MNALARSSDATPPHTASALRRFASDVLAWTRGVWHAVRRRGADPHAGQRSDVVYGLPQVLLQTQTPTETTEALWQALRTLCRCTPGLYVLQVAAEHDRPRITRATATPVAATGLLSAACLPSSVPDHQKIHERPVAWTADVDQVVGEPCTWTALSLPGHTREDAWLFVGTSAKATEEALACVRSMVHQAALAVRSQRQEDVRAPDEAPRSTSPAAVDEMVHAITQGVIAGLRGDVTAEVADPLDDQTPGAGPEAAADAAVAPEDIVVHYQPIMSATDERCTGVEALVRWQHPTRGMLGPDEFLDAAVDNGTIHEIGARVLGQALHDTQQWQAQSPERELAVHVNVTPEQIDDHRFVGTVRDCLRASTVAPGRLVFEIADSPARLSTAARGHLKELASDGVQFAVDHFAGTSDEIAALQELPVRVAKIHSATATEQPERSTEGPETILQMAQRLGLRTITDRVEDSSQHDRVRAAGADGTQGYLHARPASAAEMSAWLQGRPEARQPRPSSPASPAR